MRAGITFFISGCILIIFGLVMMIPGFLDFSDGNIHSAKAFWQSGGSTVFFGALFVTTFFNKYEKLSVREMYLTTSLVWLLVCAFCALPFYLSPKPLSYTDSFFEAMSGLTTMGATMIRDLSVQPRGILLWRGMLQWFGGVGIIFIALGILPLLRIGGMQLYAMESSDKSDKTLPKTSQIIGMIMIIYVIFTMICTILLHLSELDWFEALAYTLCTIPTGGFAPRNSSAMDLNAFSQWVMTFFMFVCGMPLMVSYFLFKKNWNYVKNDMQIRTYTYFFLCSTAILTLYLILTRDISLFTAIRYSAFNFISVVTSSGFLNSDIESWGSFAVMFFTFLLPIGACSGSTSGGIKVFRFNIMYLSSMQYLRRKILPHGIFIAKYNGKPLTEEISSGVFVFMAIFLLSFLLSVLALALIGLDFITSVSATLSSLGNTGIAFGPVIGSKGSFANLPDSAKWFLSYNMMLGRLEYMTVFVLLLPLAWRKEKKNTGSTAF